KVIDQNPIFAVLPPATRQAVMNDAGRCKYRRGEIIVCTGDVWPYLFLVLSGRIDAWKESGEGRALVVTGFHPGDLFWGLALFYDGAQTPATLKAHSDSEILLWPRDYIVPYLKDHGPMAWELSRQMVTKMARASEVLEEIAFQPVAGRLAKLLLDTTPRDASGPTTRSLTLDEMAARIGSTREVVCRFLHRFSDQGIVDITRTEFRITDPQQLARLAENSK
ncbi:MAG: Crp/Fnr family transcriptional regulator, partial [Anaerolineaceae bacterium]